MTPQNGLFIFLGKETHSETKSWKLSRISPKNSYNNNNGKPWKSLRILRVKPNFFIFHCSSFFSIFSFFFFFIFSFFHFFLFIFCFFIYFIFSFFLFFFFFFFIIFLHFFVFSHFFIFFIFFHFVHVLQFFFFFIPFIFLSFFLLFLLIFPCSFISFFLFFFFCFFHFLFVGGSKSDFFFVPQFRNDFSSHFLLKNHFFGPSRGEYPLRPLFSFFLAFVSRFNKRCFLRNRCSMEMWCLSDTGRDSWDWVGPPAWGRTCFNSPEWGGGSSLVKTEPPQNVLLLLLVCCWCVVVLCVVALLRCCCCCVLLLCAVCNVRFLCVCVFRLRLCLCLRSMPQRDDGFTLWSLQDRTKVFLVCCHSMCRFGCVHHRREEDSPLRQLMGFPWKPSWKNSRKEVRRRLMWMFSSFSFLWPISNHSSNKCWISSVHRACHFRVSGVQPEIGPQILFGCHCAGSLYLFGVVVHKTGERKQRKPARHRQTHTQRCRHTPTNTHCDTKKHSGTQTQMRRARCL